MQTAPKFRILGRYADRTVSAAANPVLLAGCRHERRTGDCNRIRPKRQCFCEIRRNPQTARDDQVDVRVRLIQKFPRTVQGIDRRNRCRVPQQKRA